MFSEGLWLMGSWKEKREIVPRKKDNGVRGTLLRMYNLLGWSFTMDLEDFPPSQTIAAR
jgi:hypothetical protein